MHYFYIKILTDLVFTTGQNTFVSTKYEVLEVIDILCTCNVLKQSIWSRDWYRNT